MPRKKPISKKTTVAKREGPSRRAKIDLWDANYLTTNPKSALVESDLISLLASPEVWAQMTKEELGHINTLLPDQVPRNEDGSISLNWLRYDNDWRHGVRQWQADLGAGRLEPKWQQEAALAMEERANGKFDKFKEEEFEEFWGQKQKTLKKMLAGQSGALKLPDLIKANLFKEGDFWVYSRFFVRGKNKTEVVKDCKIVKISENSLTFAIPPGTLRYARKISLNLSKEPNELGEDESKNILASEESVSEGAPATQSIIGEVFANGDGILDNIAEGNAEKNTLEMIVQSEGDSNQTTKERAIEEDIVTASSRVAEDIVEHTIYNVQMLEDKILKLDGRIKNPPHTSAWRSFRCQRNNQDMGSLYEIREQYWVWNHPR